MPFHTSWIFSDIESHSPDHFSDSQSVISPQFFITATTAATTAIIPAIIPATGNSTPVKNAIAPPATAIPPATTARIGSKAEITIAIPPITTIIVLLVPERLLNHFATFWMIGTSASRIGATASEMALPNSAMANFTLFSATVSSSIGSKVLLKVVSTVPWLSEAAPPRSFRFRTPLWMASTILTAPFVPNTSAAAFNASVWSVAFKILSCVSAKPSVSDFPSFA